MTTCRHLLPIEVDHIQDILVLKRLKGTPSIPLYEDFKCLCVCSNVMILNADDFSQEKNRSLNSSILTLSSQLGQLQAHEEELSSMLKLKVALLHLGLYYSTVGCWVFLQFISVYTCIYLGQRSDGSHKSHIRPNWSATGIGVVVNRVAVSWEQNVAGNGGGQAPLQRGQTSTRSTKR